MRGWRSSSLAFVRSSVTQGAEVSGRQGGRHADLPYGRWSHWWRACDTIGSLHRAQPVDRLGCADIIGKAHRNGLAGIRNGSSADGDDDVSLSGSRRLRCLDYGGPRRMRWHLIERAGAAIAECLADLVDLIRVSVERVAHHQEDTCRPQPVDLRGYSLGRRFAKYDLIHFTEEYAS